VICVVLYVHLPGGSADAVLNAEITLRAHAENVGYDVVGEFVDTSGDPAAPGLAKALDAMRAPGADVLLATDRSGMVRVGSNLAAVRDIVRTVAPYGL
jgi:hypothetical protein